VHIAATDATGGDPYENLAGPGHRSLHIAEIKHAWGGEEKGFHGACRLLGDAIHGDKEVIEGQKAREALFAKKVG
jgi:hypothetical protein